MEWGHLPLAALISGAALFAVGTVFHFLAPLVCPGLQQDYLNEALFRTWEGWTQIYMILHPWLYGVVFAASFLALRAAMGVARIGGIRDGLCYGLAVFLIGSLPVFALNFASLQLPVRVIVSWRLQSFCQYSLAGSCCGWYVGR